MVTTPPEFSSLFLAKPTINDQGVLRFTPAPNANTDNTLGPAQIEVTAVDSAGGQAQTVILPITIREINDPPVARPDSINTNEDAVLTIPSSQLLANDLDPDLAAFVFNTVFTHLGDYMLRRLDISPEDIVADRQALESPGAQAVFNRVVDILEKGMSP